MLQSRAGRLFPRHMSEEQISTGVSRLLPCGSLIHAASSADAYSAPRLAKSLSLKPNSHSVAK
jgi:hypothetical protein